MKRGAQTVATGALAILATLGFLAMSGAIAHIVWWALSFGWNWL